MTLTTNITPSDGLHRGVPFEVYQSWQAVNQSALKSGPTMAHVRWNMDHPEPPSDAMRLGTALHAALFEPALFATKYVVAPKVDKRTIEGKKVWAEFQASAGQSVLLTADERSDVQGMADGIRKHPIAAKLCAMPGEHEVCVLWTDIETGVRCKARLDKLMQVGAIVDTKSCRRAEPRKFAYDAADYGYHRQAAWYCDAVASLGIEPQAFYIVAVENTAPYLAAVYEVAPIDIAAAREQNRKALREYAAAVKSGEWPGYSNQIQPLALPAWAVANTEPEVFA